MIEIGDTVWTFHSTDICVIGPLTIRRIDEAGMCVASSRETTMRLHKSGFANSREQAADMCRSYAKSQIRGAELHLESKKAKLKEFCKKEGIEYDKK